MYTDVATRWRCLSLYPGHRCSVVLPAQTDMDLWTSTWVAPRAWYWPWIFQSCCVWLGSYWSEAYTLQFNPRQMYVTSVVEISIMVWEFRSIGPVVFRTKANLHLISKTSYCWYCSWNSCSFRVSKYIWYPVVFVIRGFFCPLFVLMLFRGGRVA